ncbi:MAG: hypothetical protein SNJ67_14450 [Chloracidobacterium sp.]
MKRRAGTNAYRYYLTRTAAGEFPLDRIAVATAQVTVAQVHTTAFCQRGEYRLEPSCTSTHWG